MESSHSESHSSSSSSHDEPLLLNTDSTSNTSSQDPSLLVGAPASRNCATSPPRRVPVARHAPHLKLLARAPWRPMLTPYRLLVILFITLVGTGIYITRTIPFDDYDYNSRLIVAVGWVAAVLCLNSLYLLGLFEERNSSACRLSRRLTVHEFDCVDWLQRWFPKRRTDGKRKLTPHSEPLDDHEQSTLLPEYGSDSFDDHARLTDKLADEPDSPVIEQFVLQDTDWESESDGPRLTAFRLLVTTLVLGVGLYKGCVSYSRASAVGTAEDASDYYPVSSRFELGFEAECITGTMGAIGLYWLSLYETSPCYVYPSLFHADHRKNIQRGFKTARTHSLFIFCILGSILSLAFSIGCLYFVLRIPGMGWIDTPAPSKGLYAAATKPLAMVFSAAMACGGLFGAHSLFEEGLRVLHPRGGMTPYRVFSNAVNSVMGQEMRQQVWVWMITKWRCVRAWAVREVLSERTPLRKAITRQLRGLPYTILISGLYTIATLMFVWLGSMGVALIKTLEGGEHWIALVLIWGCAMIEMGIALCMICVFGVWFKGFVWGLVMEFRKDLQDGCEDAE